MNNSFFKNPCNQYLLLWSLYNLKGTLYVEGTIINQVLMLILLLLSAKEMLWYNRNKNSLPNHAFLFFDGMKLLLLLYVVYGLLIFITEGTTYMGKPTKDFLQAYLISFLPIYASYTHTIKGDLTVKNFQVWMIVFLIVGICQFYYNERLALIRLLESGKDAEEFTNNASYIVMALIPGMLLFHNKKIVMYGGIAICTFYVVLGMKRGAIIISALILASIMYNHLKTAKASQKIGALFIVFSGIYALSLYINSLMSNSAYFNSRVDDTLEGDTSNRDVIYGRIWDIYIDQSDIFQALFGRGAMGTLKYGCYAHNDWLEILFDHGVLGILFFVYFWRCWYKTSLNRQYTQLSRLVIVLVLVMFGLKTFFSMSIGGMSIFATSVLGFALADGFTEDSESL